MWSTVQDMKDLVQILTPCAVFILAPETVSADSAGEKKRKKVFHAASTRLKNPTRELCMKNGIDNNKALLRLFCVTS